MHLPMSFILSETDATIPPEAQRKMFRMVEEKSRIKVQALPVDAGHVLAVTSQG